MFRLAYFLCLLIALAAQPLRAESIGKPALWMVKASKTTIYIFAAAHALPEGVNWYDGEVKQAFETSDLYIDELGKPDPLQIREALKVNGFMPRDLPLAKIVGAQVYRNFLAILPRLEIDEATANRLRPWLAAQIIERMCNEGQFRPELGVGSILLAKAETLGKAVAGLEGASAQFAHFGELPRNFEMEMLIDSIDNCPKALEETQSRIAAWQRGDLAAAAEFGKFSQGLIDRVAGYRSKMWADWIEVRLGTPGTVFIAGSAGNFIGSGSVQQLLEQRGYKVYRVQ